MSDEHFEAQSARMERLLDQLEAVTGPSTWPLVQDLVTVLVDLYGTGLERLLTLAREHAASADELCAGVTQDHSLSGLLLLHGIHPLPLERRVDRALARLAAEVPSPPARIEVTNLGGSSVTLRVFDASDETSAGSFAQLAARAIERAAPEITAVHIEGLSLSPRPEPLIPVGRLTRPRP